MSEIVIKEIFSKRDIRSFINFPDQLYRDCPYYVPSIKKDDLFTLKKHPAKSFCSIRLWLAYRGKEIVGRIAGIINHKCNELKDQRRIRFGWFDTIEDPEVARLLFQEVENWGRAENLSEISGPSRFSNMEKQGLLVEGFDVPQSITTEYNYPYYPLFIEEMGFQKEVDYLQYKIKVNPVPEKIERLYKIIQHKYQIKVQPFKNNKEMMAYAKGFFLSLNDSFENIYNFIPLTNEEIDYLIKSNFSFARPDLVSILTDPEDHIVGFAFCVPSLTHALQKCKGRLFPFGWYYISEAFRKSDTVNLILTGTTSEWQQHGIHVIYHKLLNETFIEKGYEYAISNPQLENITAGRIWNKYESEFYCRRRCYVKKL